MRFPLIIFLLFISGSVFAQKLDFLGLTGMHFGMKIKELPAPQLMLDTSSSYDDTALYLKSTRCQMYYSKTQNMQLDGFMASAIEYQFCDSLLSYVFVRVSGKEEIAKAMTALKVDFPKMSCGKNVPVGMCTFVDTTNRHVRLILKVDSATNEMSFVIIPRKAAG